MSYTRIPIADGRWYLARSTRRIRSQPREHRARTRFERLVLAPVLYCGGSGRPRMDPNKTEARVSEKALCQRAFVVLASCTGMNLWLVPANERAFQQTLAEPVDLSGWQGRPDSFPEQARVWGVRTDPEQGSWERNRRNLKRMERGDPLLVYRNGVGRYVAAARVGTMTHTEFVRDTYWDGGPALDVYAVEEWDDSVDVAAEEVNELLGYKRSFRPQGLWRVSDDRPVDRVIDRFDL